MLQWEHNRIRGGMDVGELFNWLEQLVTWLAEYAIVLFEIVGIVTIIVAGVQGVAGLFRRDPLTRLKLAKGMAMAVEFKLGGEILRTVVVREFSEIMMVGAIILLRAALTFLIHWEIKNEEAVTQQGEGADRPEK